MPAQIVAIMLVRNEDIYIERVIRNIADFCDKIIITDHRSTDRTFEICERLAGQIAKIDLRQIQSPEESGQALEPYFGTDTWIFGVDGDEIYDPQGLKTMRKLLLEGAFSKDWCIFGNALNVISLDLDKKIAKGHLAPPCRPTSKLYNFSFIDWWDSGSERLHGEDIKFKDGFSSGLRRYLHTEMPWEAAYFRHLHMPFMKRSSGQKSSFIKTRLNPNELLKASLEKNWLFKMWRELRVQVSRFLGLDWKNKKYRRGPLVQKDISQFFPPD